MNVIGHAVYLQHFVAVLLKDARYVLMQSLFPGFIYLCSPVSYCKNKLNVNLGIAI